MGSFVWYNHLCRNILHLNTFLSTDGNERSFWWEVSWPFWNIRQERPVCLQCGPQNLPGSKWGRQCSCCINRYVFVFMFFYFSFMHDIFLCWLYFLSNVCYAFAWNVYSALICMITLCFMLTRRPSFSVHSMEDFQDIIIIMICQELAAELGLVQHVLHSLGNLKQCTVRDSTLKL